MKEGFITALGTPIDQNGDFAAQGFVEQVEDQVAAGAAGLLVMGSMGMQPCVKDADCPKVAAAAAEQAKGRCPVLVGVMDNSVGRVRERIDRLRGLKIDGVVATTPYYFPADQDSLIGFFAAIAERSPYPLYLYDLPAITKTKITPATVERLLAEPNIRGIKTGDLMIVRRLVNRPRNEFELMYANLDTTDIAWTYGAHTFLDGMYSVTAPLATKLVACLKSGDSEQAAKALDDIVRIRDAMLAAGLWQAYTSGMNLLGYRGRFHPDYLPPVPEEKLMTVRQCMAECGLPV
jgi:4-hydroxy-tetrahydrodipicolinate synthase